MPIRHSVIGLAIFAGLAAFIGFAFRQRLWVKPDRNKDPDEWAKYGGPPIRRLRSFGLIVQPKGHCPATCAEVE
jgi:hypothetical protein